MAGAALAVPAVASAAPCPAQPTTTPFTGWGDTASYFLLPDGNFESPLWSSGWTAIGAERTLGNEPFYVGGSSDSYALTINGGGIVTSPAFCVDDSMPYLRFFAQALGASGSLHVRLVVQTSGGTAVFPFSSVADLTAASMPNWAPTAQLTLADRPKLANGQSGIGRLVFDVSGNGADAWQIDDIYADPFRSG